MYASLGHNELSILSQSYHKLKATEGYHITAPKYDFLITSFLRVIVYSILISCIVSRVTSIQLQCSKHWRFSISCLILMIQQWCCGIVSTSCILYRCVSFRAMISDSGESEFQNSIGPSVLDIFCDTHIVVWFYCPTLISRYMGPTWGRQDPGGPHVGPMIALIFIVMNMYLSSSHDMISEITNMPTHLEAKSICLHPFMV